MTEREEYDSKAFIHSFYFIRTHFIRTSKLRFEKVKNMLRKFEAQIFFMLFIAQLTTTNIAQIGRELTGFPVMFNCLYNLCNGSKKQYHLKSGFHYEII